MGAECTGKTTLAGALAGQFGGLWVPEYLRTFCQQQGRTPKAHEQAMVMRGQFELEQHALVQATLAGKSYVFCDTAPLLVAIYSDFYFFDRSLHDSAHVLHGRYALTLVLCPDVPWVGDGFQRDGEATRSAVHAKVLHELQTTRHPHIEVSGQGANRVRAAVQATETLLS